MATTQYIGARYVPLIGRKGESSVVWDNSAPYEPLTVVTYQGDSYTSRQSVPAGIAITNTDYWVKTGDYNAQVASYVQQVTNLQSNVSAVEDALPVADFSAQSTVKDAIDGIADVLPLADFDSVNTVKAAIDAVSGGASTDIATIKAAMPISAYDAQNTIKDAIDAEILARSNADTTLQNNITTAVGNEANARSNADNVINANITSIQGFLPLNFGIADRMNDYVVETDSADGWTWQKFNSGVCYCFGDFAKSGVSMTNQEGAAYFSTTSYQETFPAGLFTDVKACFITISPGTAGVSGIEIMPGLSTSTTHSYYPYRLESASTMSMWVMVFAVGFWK